MEREVSRCRKQMRHILIERLLAFHNNTKTEKSFTNTTQHEFRTFPRVAVILKVKNVDETDQAVDVRFP